MVRSPSRRQRRPESWNTFRPRVECLEDRTVPSTTVLTVSPTSVSPGQALTLTATVTGDNLVPGTYSYSPWPLPDGVGDVTFYDGSHPFQTVSIKPLDAMDVAFPSGGQGTATLTLLDLGPGRHTFSAVYSGQTYDYIGTITTEAGSASNTVTVGADGVTNVTGSVAVTFGKARPASQQLTLKNTGALPLQGPLFVVIEGLTPEVQVGHAAGFTQTHGAPGSPFIKLNVSQLAPGDRLPLRLLFKNPHHKKPHFTVEVFAGAGSSL